MNGHTGGVCPACTGDKGADSRRLLELFAEVISSTCVHCIDKSLTIKIPREGVLDLDVPHTAQLIVSAVNSFKRCRSRIKLTIAVDDHDDIHRFFALPDISEEIKPDNEPFAEKEQYERLCSYIAREIKLEKQK